MRVTFGRVVRNGPDRAFDIFVDDEHVGIAVRSDAAVTRDWLTVELRVGGRRVPLDRTWGRQARRAQQQIAAALRGML